MYIFKCALVIIAVIIIIPRGIVVLELKALQAHQGPQVKLELQGQ